LLQFIILFPLFFYALRKVKIDFGWICLLSIVLQLVMFWFQKEILRFTYPGSLFAWYFVVFIPGVWIGLNWKDSTAIWRKWRFPLAFTFIATFLWFMMRAMQTIIDLPVNGFEMNVSEKLFTMVGALTLLGLSLAWTEARNFVSRGLRAIGRASLQLYLFHPILIFYLSGPRIGGLIGRAPLSPLVFIVLLVAISYLFALFCSFTGLERPLFGRTDPLIRPFWLIGKRSEPETAVS
jgi:peptidoglycan/LPS O-acetylase OafA/YrhL